MPATATLSEEQRARVEAGQCACGCGEELPKYSGWNEPSIPPVWSSSACRAKGYRQRKARGQVVTMSARRAMKLHEEAQQLDRGATHAEERAREYAAEAKRARLRAAELRAQANGQTTILDRVAS